MFMKPLEFRTLLGVSTFRRTTQIKLENIHIYAVSAHVIPNVSYHGRFTIILISFSFGSLISLKPACSPKYIIVCFHHVLFMRLVNLIATRTWWAWSCLAPSVACELGRPWAWRTERTKLEKGHIYAGSAQVCPNVSYNERFTKIPAAVQAREAHFLRTSRAGPTLIIYFQKCRLCLTHTQTHTHTHTHTPELALQQLVTPHLVSWGVA